MIFKELVALANQGPNILTQIGSIASAHQYLLLYDLTKKSIPKGAVILDWGAGNGHFSYFLCRTGYKAAGFSMEKFGFKNWLKGYPYKFVQGKTDQPTLLPFKDKLFDAVASVGVLEHVQEFGGSQTGSMKEIARILRPNGIFICYHLPNYYSLIEYTGKLITNKFHHIKRFTQKDILNLADKTGFRIIEIRRYGFLPRNSLGRLPSPFRYSVTLATVWDILDIILGFLFSPICQNYYFVARKI